MIRATGVSFRTTTFAGRRSSSGSTGMISRASHSSAWAAAFADGGNMRGRHRQSGLTLIGFIFVAAVVLSLALIGFRVAPSYIEYFSVVKILHQMMTDAKEGATLADFRRDFDRRAAADYIESVRANDVDLIKQ